MDSANVKLRFIQTSQITNDRMGPTQMVECSANGNLSCTLTLTVPVTTIDALGHFETG